MIRSSAVINCLFHHFFYLSVLVYDSPWLLVVSTTSFVKGEASDADFVFVNSFVNF